MVVVEREGDQAPIHCSLITLLMPSKHFLPLYKLASKRVARDVKRLPSPSRSRLRGHVVQDPPCWSFRPQQPEEQLQESAHNECCSKLSIDTTQYP